MLCRFTRRHAAPNTRRRRQCVAGADRSVIITAQTVPHRRAARIDGRTRQSFLVGGIEAQHSRTIACHRSEEHTSELQSLMRISYAVFCLKKKKTDIKRKSNQPTPQLTHTTITQLKNTTGTP